MQTVVCLLISLAFSNGATASRPHKQSRLLRNWRQYVAKAIDEGDDGDSLWSE